MSLPSISGRESPRKAYKANGLRLYSVKPAPREKSREESKIREWAKRRHLKQMMDDYVMAGQREGKSRPKFGAKHSLETGYVCKGGDKGIDSGTTFVRGR